jgi:hypothetical protein
MRTTVTLDSDVAAKLKAVARQRGISFKQALNQAVRAGLGGPRRSGQRFAQPTHPMGLRPGLDLDKALKLASALEDEEIARRLEVRKCGSSMQTFCSMLPTRDRPATRPPGAGSSGSCRAMTRSPLRGLFWSPSCG